VQLTGILIKSTNKRYVKKCLKNYGLALKLILKLDTLPLQTISIVDALHKHWEQYSIVEAMSKPMAVERLHRAMVKVA
jgi:TPP-dependent indolepyruvate ferredoxin oxidoreductase alpha subunit